MGGCSTATNYCEPNPDYSVDLQGAQRTSDLAPHGTGFALAPSSKALHTYTFTHVAEQTQNWLRIVWQ